MDCGDDALQAPRGEQSPGSRSVPLAAIREHGNMTKVHAVWVGKQTLDKDWGSSSGKKLRTQKEYLPATVALSVRDLFEGWK